MNERLRKIREHYNLNQREFSQKIKIGQSTLAMLETGQRMLKDIHISQICSAFNVSESWLRYGEGEMIIQNDSTILSELSKEYKLDNIDRKIIESYVKLSSEHRKAIKEYVRTLAAVISVEDEIAASIEEDAIEKELNAYRLELEAEKKGTTLPASLKQKENIG